MYLAGTWVGFPQVWVWVQIYLPTRRPVPTSTHTCIYMVGWHKMVIQKNSSQAVRRLHQCLLQSTTIQYISATILIYIYIHIPIFFTHPFHEYCIHLIPMPRDEVNPSFITNKPWKRTLSSYVHNQDIISGDRDQYVKRIKQTVNPGMFPNNSYFSP